MPISPKLIRIEIAQCEDRIEHLKMTCVHETLFKGPYGCASCYACGYEFMTQFCEESPNSMCKYTNQELLEECEYCGSNRPVHT